MTDKTLADWQQAAADEAVRSARAAFESGTWSGLPAAERKMVLARWAELIEAHADELALLETLDVGKPVADTVNVDVPASVRTIRWTGEAIDKVYDQISPTRNNCLGLITRLPLGVVAAIVPWNFPLSTTAWKLAPALATGNSVILKPASNTPLSALRIADLATEAGLPEGVLHVLPGPGGSLGEHIATHRINNYFGGDITVPFGGFKESGNGRDKSMHAFDDYTELKTTWLEFE